jgi:hypothetical protein
LNGDVGNAYGFDEVIRPAAGNVALVEATLPCTPIKVNWAYCEPAAPMYRPYSHVLAGPNNAAPVVEFVTLVVAVFPNMTRP